MIDECSTSPMFISSYLQDYFHYKQGSYKVHGSRSLSSTLLLLANCLNIILFTIQLILIDLPWTRPPYYIMFVFTMEFLCLHKSCPHQSFKLVNCLELLHLDIHF